MKNDVIFVRWELSWTGTRTILSIHKTLTGALAAIPDNIKNTFISKSSDKYILNYGYQAIEEITVLD